jgi:hypothetical protein
MFAPPVMSPALDLRPATDRAYTPQPHRSLSWNLQAGLPPPPSEIDQYQDLDRALVHSAPLRRTPSPYDSLVDPDSEVDTYAMPMNATSKHPKLKLKIVLAHSVFEADGSISGALEVTSSTSQRLRLGEIAIELEASEGEEWYRSHFCWPTY